MAWNDNLTDYFAYIKKHKWGDSFPTFARAEDVTLESVITRIHEVIAQEKTLAAGSPESRKASLELDALRNALGLLTGGTVTGNDGYRVTHAKVPITYPYNKTKIMKMGENGEIIELPYQPPSGIERNQPALSITIHDADGKVIGHTTDNVLLGRVAPKDCPLTWSNDPTSPFHIEHPDRGKIFTLKDGKLVTPAAPIEAKPPVSEPQKSAPVKPVAEEKMKVRATPGAKELPAEKWTPQHVETVRDRLRVEKVEVVKRPMQVLNAEGIWVDAEPLLVLKATKTVNGQTHVLELSGQEVIHAVKNPSKLFEIPTLKGHPVLGEFFQEHGGAPARPVSHGSGYSPAKPVGSSVENVSKDVAKAEEGVGQWVARVFKEHPGKSWGVVAAGAAAVAGIGYWALKSKKSPDNEAQQQSAAAKR